MAKPRIMYVLWHYPQISETYIEAEINALKDDYDIRVISRTPVGGNTTSYKEHYPFDVIEDPKQVVRAIREFRPQVMHTHWLLHVGDLIKAARGLNIPFTIRAHSFDTILSQDTRLTGYFRHIGTTLPDVARDELCLGILAFPFSRDFLLSYGVPEEKIHDCWPVINYERFYDRSPNGSAVMNTGACIPKKKMEDFLELGRRMPETEFNIYPVSYKVEDITRKNEKLGNPVNLKEPIEPRLMAPEYKKHRWLVYTACPRLHNVGWPLAVAEAQASGVGVLLANVRPDMKEFIGDAGFLYDSLDEAERILRQPVPDEIREKGFLHAKKSDIQEHKHILTDIWDAAIGQPARQSA